MIDYEATAIEGGPEPISITGVARSILMLAVALLEMALAAVFG